MKLEKMTRTCTCPCKEPDRLPLGGGLSGVWAIGEVNDESMREERVAQRENRNSSTNLGYVWLPGFACQCIRLLPKSLCLLHRSAAVSDREQC